MLRYDREESSVAGTRPLHLKQRPRLPGIYAVLAEKGFFPEAELWKFCASDGILGGHPEYGKVPGVEASTGSLGHGISIGVGFALDAKLESQKHRVFVMLGDGECGEGGIWEAALCASATPLDQLTVLIDYNKQQTLRNDCRGAGSGAIHGQVESVRIFRRT